MIAATRLLTTALLAASTVAIASAQTPVEIAATGAEQEARRLLDRLAKLKVEGVTLEAALLELIRRSDVPLAFSPGRLGRGARVSCECENVSVSEALDRLLAGSGMDYLEMAGQVVLFPAGGARPERLNRVGAFGALASADVGIISRLRSVAPVLSNEPRTVQGTIVGRVTDAGTGAPLASAQVSIVGTTIGQLTNNDGRYILPNVPPGLVQVRAVRVGYAAQTRSVEVVAQGTATADFALSVSATRLDDVVVTATGEQRRVELGHVVGRIHAETVMRESPVTSLSDLIGARVSGVQVIPNAGFTGESPRIRIRGINSISRSRDPLLYVDGVRVEGGSATVINPVAGFISSYGLVGGHFNNLNPDEIESIEVVKGPSAATLYGTDAANGVILIRTKSGRPGATQWKAYVEGGKLRPGTSFRNATGYFSWGTNSATGSAQRCLITQIAAGICTQDSLSVFNPLAHPETTPIATGTRWKSGLQVSGGAAHLTYFLSGDYEQETGYLRMPSQEVERIRGERIVAELPDWQLRPNHLERMSLRGSLTANIGQNTDVRVSSSLVSSSTRIPGNQIFSGGYYGPGYRDVNNGWRTGSRPGEAFAIKSADEIARYTGSISANWRHGEWLDTRLTVGTDVSSSYYDGLQRPGEGPPGAGRDGRRLNSRTNVTQHSVDLGGSATTWITHQLGSRTSIGVQLHRRRQEITIASATGLPPGSKTVTGAASVIGNEGRVESLVAGAYLEQMFSVNERLFVTGGVRTDGGSSFGRHFRTAVYPKASASWVLSREPFFPGSSNLENLRLRLAYGHSGVQPGSTDALDLIARFTSIVHGVPMTGAALSRLGNPQLKPERQREIEAGFDLDFGRRVTIEATFYDRLSSNALIEVPLASSVGLGSRWENLGAVRNRGYEAAIELHILQNAWVSWQATLNGSVNRNRLERLGVAGLTQLGINGFLHREGFPLFGRWSIPILGYADTNGNGIIEPGEIELGDTLVFLGPSHPPRQLTASTALSFIDGRLRFSSQLDYRGGHRGMNFAAVNQCLLQVCRALNDPDASLAEQADAVARTLDSNAWAGYMDDASFIRWREVAATYQLPEGITRRLGASNLHITLSGRNLRLWTGYKGVDPEVNAMPGWELVEGSHGNPTAPQTRYWLLRIDTTF